MESTFSEETRWSFFIKLFLCARGAIVLTTRGEKEVSKAGRGGGGGGGG